MKRITSQSTGLIILTKANFVLFRIGTNFSPREEAIVRRNATLAEFRRFAVYCQDINMLKGAKGEGCLTTFQTLYKEFKQVDFNRSMSAILAENNINASAPEANPLNAECGNPAFDSSWLRKTRSWLQVQLARVSFLARRPRQIENLT